MSIGLSRNARFLLAQLVEAYHRGEQEGLSGDQLSFTLSVRADQTTAVFASGNPPIQTCDANAILVLRANRLIEEFTSLAGSSNVRRYVVTQSGMNVVRSISLLTEDARNVAAGSAESDPSGSRADKLIAPGGDESHG